MSRAQIQPSWFPEVLTGLAKASGVGYLAAAYTISRWLTRPSRGRPQRTPADFRLPWEPLECRTPDGHHLAGWAVTPTSPRATVVLFHGMRNHREQILDRLAFLAGAGYRCVAFDHRAHGESTGKRTSFGFHESQDVAAVAELVEQKWPAQRRVALGVSMGAAAVCYAARAVRGWAAVILESMYHDLASAFRNRMGTDFPVWFRQISSGVIWVTERRLGLRLDQLAPVRHIGHLAPAPVLLITGDKDPHAPPEDAERLVAACQAYRELLLVAEADHENVFERGASAYRQRVLDFLGRYV